jgi:hypothetical protein
MLDMMRKSWRKITWPELFPYVSGVYFPQDSMVARGILPCAFFISPWPLSSVVYLWAKRAATDRAIAHRGSVDPLLPKIIYLGSRCPRQLRLLFPTKTAVLGPHGSPTKPPPCSPDRAKSFSTRTTPIRRRTLPAKTGPSFRRTRPFPEDIRPKARPTIPFQGRDSGTTRLPLPVPCLLGQGPSVFPMPVP